MNRSWSGRGYTGLALGVLLACASSQRPVKDAGLRATAAHDLDCDGQRLTSEDLTPRTVRVSGCGRSALYSCEQAGISETPPGTQENVPEYEAKNRQPTGVGQCSWVQTH